MNLQKTIHTAGALTLASLLVLAAHAQDFNSPRLDAETSWVGNSYGGATSWVQHDIAAMAVTAEGTVFTNVFWEEAGGNCGEYRDGALVRFARKLHGWGNNGGDAVAANSRYVYIGSQVDSEGGGLKDPGTWPPKGVKWQGISRRLRADISQGAKFDGGKGGKGDSLTASFLVIAEVPEAGRSASIPGIAADETRVYVADPHSREVKVFDAETMQWVAGWKINKAGPLALDRSGRLWLLERKTDDAPGRLLRFNAKGDVEFTYLFAADVVPLAFCLTNDERVLVADDSAAQQIRIFEIKDGKLGEVGRFGEPGGIAGGVPGLSVIASSTRSAPSAAMQRTTFMSPTARRAAAAARCSRATASPGTAP